MDAEDKAAEVRFALVKGLVGMVPIAGPLIAETIGTLIPNQRIERLESFFDELNHRHATSDPEWVRAQLHRAECTDLLEDSMLQAVRALSPERTTHLAELMSRGLDADSARLIRLKHLIGLLGELNDVELILLRGCAIHPDLDAEFWERHKEIFEHIPPPVGASGEEVERETFRASYLAHLARLNLLDDRARRATIPQEHYTLTPLGEALLRAIGLLPDDAES